jgi:hypothetical protein
MGMLVIVKYWGVFQDKKRNATVLSTVKTLEENWFIWLSTRHWEINSPFSRTITRKHKANFTQEMLTTKTGTVPEWQSYCIVLNMIENLWQSLKNGCRAMINNHFDRA